MVFKVASTFEDPASSQSGFAMIGAGQQTVGPYTPPPTPVAQDPVRPTKGLFSWLFPVKLEDSQRGFPSPDAPNQMRPDGSMPNRPPIFGGVYQQYTPYYSRGAAAYVPNFGNVLYNPIGSGVVALNRPQASYGGAAQYENGALWWTSQAIPTSINLQGLTDPEALNEILGSILVQGVVRTTG